MEVEGLTVTTLVVMMSFAVLASLICVTRPFVILEVAFDMSVHLTFSLPHNFAACLQGLETILRPNGDEGAWLSHN